MLGKLESKSAGREEITQFFTDARALRREKDGTALWETCLAAVASTCIYLLFSTQAPTDALMTDKEINPKTRHGVRSDRLFHTSVPTRHVRLSYGARRGVF